MTITVYRDAEGAWRWQVKDGKGVVVSDSAEGYESKGWAVHMATTTYPGATLHLKDTQRKREA